MNKLYSTLTALLLFCGSFSSRAQNYPPLQPEQDPCGALPICGGVWSTPYAYDGYGAVNNFSQPTGCFDESASVWLKIEVATAGDIVFTINPVIAANDYDFVVYDMTGVNCNNLSYANMVRCNGSQYGYTGLSYTATGTWAAPGPTQAFIQYLPANAGDVFYIMVNNFTTNNVSGFTIDFTGSTATFVSGPTPEFGSILSACTYSSGVTIQLTQPVQCSSIAADGSDFSVPGTTVVSAAGINCIPGGYTDKVTLTFGTPLPAGSYVVNAQTGTDGNTLLGLCNNALQLPESINFNVSPFTSPQMQYVDTPACIRARIHFDRDIDCATVAADGSDFSISGPGPVTIVKANPVGCDAASMTDTVDVFFSSSILVPGTYTISVKQGTDGDLVTDTCGFAVNNTVSFVVSDQGGVIGTASPSILCEKGFVQLNSQPLLPAPSAQLNCGVHAGTLAGTATTYQIGTATTGTTSYTPFYGFYEDGRTQMLFTAAELQAAGITTGSIDKLSFVITAKNSSAPYNNFSIKMGCTNLTSMSGGFVPGLSQVYGPVSYTSVSGNNSFTLTNPYDWDGVSNLIVEICFDNSAYTSSDAIQYTSTGSLVSVYHRHDDGVIGCAMATSAGFGGSSSNRPNINFSVVPPPPGGYGFLWTPSAFVGDTTAQNTSAFVNHTTTYTVRIMDTFRCYRRDTAQVIVSVRNPTLVPEGDTAICGGDAILLQAGGGSTYNWYPSAGLSCDNCAEVEASPNTSTNYSVVITDQYGCSDTLHTNITVNQLPLVQASPDSVVVKYGQTIELVATGAGDYLWMPSGSLSNPRSPNPVATVTEPVRIVVQGIDSNHCVSTDTVRIGVDYRDHLMVPSAFSPNNDGKNDVFRIANFSFQKLQEFRVFNRWGQEVFSTNDGRQGWDGTWKGTPQDPGVYQFIIRVAYPDGYVETYKGDVTLIR